MILRREKRLNDFGILLKKFGIQINLMLKKRKIKKRNIIFLNNNYEILIKKWMMNCFR
jgi:hypothetical protein